MRGYGAGDGDGCVDDDVGLGAGAGAEVDLFVVEKGGCVGMCGFLERGFKESGICD